MIPFSDKYYGIRHRLHQLFLIMFVIAIIPNNMTAQNTSADSSDTSITSKDISKEEMVAVAEIIVALQIERQQMRMEMMKKYDNPQEMDSTERRKVKAENLEKRQALVEKKTEEKNLSAERLNLIMRSATTDSTLRARLKKVVKEKRKEQILESDGN